MTTTSGQFVSNVIHYITQEAREIATEYKYGAGGAELEAEFADMRDDVEFTLVGDSSFRMFAARLEKFYLENENLLEVLAELTNRDSALELDSLVFVSLFLSGDGIESAYLGADDSRDLAELYSKVLSDMLMRSFPYDIGISVEPNGAAYIDY